MCYSNKPEIVCRTSTYDCIFSFFVYYFDPFGLKLTAVVITLDVKICSGLVRHILSKIETTNTVQLSPRPDGNLAMRLD